MTCLLLAGLALAPPQAAFAQDGERSAWGEAGLGVLAVGASLLYSPAKVIYAGAGALTAGFAYVLSGGQPDLSRVLLSRSLRGDYVVTREHLTRQRALAFVGPDPESETQPVGEPYPY